MERFDEFLKEVGTLLGVPLHPDKNRACKMSINNVLHIQIEEDATKEKLLIACFLCDIPPGKFRENILREALKSNDFYPRTGTLSYSERNNKLACFEFLSWHNLTAQKFLDFFAKFIEKADNWRVAVESGQTAPIKEKTQTQTSPNIFGIKT